VFNNLLYAVKRRILDEVIDTFNKHPAYSEKVKIHHKFPYKERVQYGVVLKNTSASLMRMSPDNFLGDLVTHVRMAKVANYPGYSIEWVREDTNNLTEYELEEDVSSQLSPTQRQFQVAKFPIMAGDNNTQYADNFAQVEITVNGARVFAEFVDGKSGVVLLNRAPPSGAVVKISYYYQTMSPPGYYFVDFIADNQFEVGAYYTVDNEVVIEDTDGTETNAFLNNNPIVNGTEDLFLQSTNGGLPIELIVGTDYTINDATGEITFLVPLTKSFQLLANYTYGTGSAWGPFTFEHYQDVHTAIPGVVLSIGRRAKQGDKQVVIVSKFREVNARVFGGHWTMSMNLQVIAKDSIQMEEMTDHLISDFWGTKKNQLEFEGITLNSIEPTGEVEETYVELTGDLYYECSVDISVQTEWQKFVPYRFDIKRVIPSLYFYPRTGDYRIIGDGTDSTAVDGDLVPDTRFVVKYPLTGFERVT